MGERRDSRDDRILVARGAGGIVVKGLGAKLDNVVRGGKGNAGEVHGQLGGVDGALAGPAIDDGQLAVGGVRALGIVD